MIVLIPHNETGIKNSLVVGRIVVMHIHTPKAHMDLGVIRRAGAQGVEVWGGWQFSVKCSLAKAQSRASHLTTHGNGAPGLLRRIEGVVEKPKPNMLCGLVGSHSHTGWSVTILYLT